MRYFLSFFLLFSVLSLGIQRERIIDPNLSTRTRYRSSLTSGIIDAEIPFLFHLREPVNRGGERLRRFPRFV